MNDIFLSVVIPTLNRSKYVTQCLREAILQASEYRDVEIIVVDNGSTDDTAEKVNELIRESEPLGVSCTYLYEPVKGSNRSRNVGCNAAHGRAVALLDDDAVPLKGWVKGYRDHFLHSPSDCVAGRVELRPEAPLPEWLPPSMAWILGKTEYGDLSRALQPGEYPQSNNCAFMMHVFKTLNGFNSNSLIYGDETEFFRRAEKAGFSAYYRHDIVVDHCVPLERLSRKGLYNKARLWGCGDAFFRGLDSSRSKTVLRSLEFTLRTMYVGARWCLSPTFPRAYTFNFNWGHLKQSCIQVFRRGALRQ